MVNEIEKKRILVDLWIGFSYYKGFLCSGNYREKIKINLWFYL